MDRANGVSVPQIVGRTHGPRPAPTTSANSPSVLPTSKAGNTASYGFSVSRPVKYLWMTLDRSV